MKTILVLAGGGETDETVFDTALAVARPCGAHLEFLHVSISRAHRASRRSAPRVICDILENSMHSVLG